MNHHHSAGPRFAAALALGLLIAGAACGQTVFYSNGTGAIAASGLAATGTLAALDWISTEYNHDLDLTTGGAPYITAGSATGFDFSGRLSSNYSFTPPLAPVGTELSGIMLWVKVENKNPAGGVTTFQAYSGINASGLSADFDIDGAHVGQYVSIFIPVEIGGDGDFSLGYTGNNLAEQLYFNAYTDSAGSDESPGLGLIYTDVVPEPSSALLGTLGALTLFRRIRA